MSMFKSLITAAALAVAASGVSAKTIKLDGNSRVFKTDGEVWTHSFEFVIDAGQTAYLTVSDMWWSGDVYEVFVNKNGTGSQSAGLTSTPVASEVGTFIGFGNDANGAKAEAIASDIWSTGSILLDAGSYSVTGTVATDFGRQGKNPKGIIALTSSFLTEQQLASSEQLTRAVQPEASVVPLPAAGWMLLAGLGGLGLMRRKS